MAADIPFLEVTGRKSKQNGGRSNWKNNQGFRANSRPSREKKGISCFFIKRTLYFYNNKTQKKIGLLSFSSPLSAFLKEAVEEELIISMSREL